MQRPLNLELVIELRLPAVAERLALVRAMVDQAARLQGCDAALSGKLVLAVNEACMNVIQHAYGDSAGGDLKLAVYGSGSALLFRLEDRAGPVDLDSVRPRKLDEIRPGGLGVHFIQEIMDACEMGHLDEGGNYLEMLKHFS